MARHSVFTIVADIKEGCEDELRALDPAFRPNQPLPAPDFAQLEMVHFASFVVLDHARLGAKRSKLVFECNIDGPVPRFLEALLADPALDGIYQFCEGYPVNGDKLARLAYLRHPKRLRRPQLFHVGAPYRTATSIRQDRHLRRQLDGELDGLMAPSLTEYRGGTIPGMRDYGTWDAVVPWAAWIIGISGPALALWIAVLAARSTLPRVTSVLLTLFCVGFAVIALVAAFKMWIGVIPQLRDRVRPWLKWAVAGIIVGIGARALWQSQRTAALVLLGVYGLGVVATALAVVWQRANQRLALIRSNTAGPSVASIWKALRRDAPKGDRVNWGQRILNWSVWPIAYALLYFPIRWMAPHRWVLISVLTVLLLLKALWLAALLGWPAKDKKIRQDYTRIVTFIIGLPAIAFAALFVLTGLGLDRYPSVLALVGLVGVFSLWAMPLPSPKVTFAPLDREQLAAIRSVEDQDVTNHMSAVVVLNQDHRFRVPVLKSFLWLLNRFYFRVLLPDVYRGKLWGIPTVQFAQWVMLDRRNFVFLSNYDHSWTSYLDDFGLTLTTGIQKIWGQGLDNPGTKDLDRFKDYARTTMVRHSFWYRAYPGLTLRQIWNNEQIRRALVKARSEQAMMRALRRFGAARKILPDPFHARTI